MDILPCTPRKDILDVRISPLYNYATWELGVRSVNLLQNNAIFRWPVSSVESKSTVLVSAAVVSSSSSSALDGCSDGVQTEMN